MKVLTGERDRLAELYEQAKEEAQRARHDLVRKASNKGPSLAAQHVLKRIEEVWTGCHLYGVSLTVS